VAGDEEAPQDQPRIADDTVVLRRIPPHNSTSPLPEGDFRPNSDNFKDDEDGELCVDLKLDDEQPARTLEGHDGFGLIALTVEEIRSVGLDVEQRKLDENPAHAIIVGNKTQGRRKKLSLFASARWIKRPASLEELT